MPNSPSHSPLNTRKFGTRIWEFIRSHLRLFSRHPCNCNYNERLHNTQFSFLFSFKGEKGTYRNWAFFCPFSQPFLAETNYWKWLPYKLWNTFFSISNIKARSQESSCYFNYKRQKYMKNSDLLSFGNLTETDVDWERNILDVEIFDLMCMGDDDV